MSTLSQYYGLNDSGGGNIELGQLIEVDENISRSALITAGFVDRSTDLYFSQADYPELTAITDPIPDLDIYDNHDEVTFSEIALEVGGTGTIKQHLFDGTRHVVITDTSIYTTLDVLNGPWVKSPTTISVAFYNALATDGNGTWAIAQNGSVLHTTDPAGTWTENTAPIRTYGYGMAYGYGRWLYLSRYGIETAEDVTGAFTERYYSANLRPYVALRVPRLHATNKIWVAGGYQGKTLYSTNNGDTWVTATNSNTSHIYYLHDDGVLLHATGLSNNNIINSHYLSWVDNFSTYGYGFKIDHHEQIGQYTTTLGIFGKPDDAGKMGIKTLSVAPSGAKVNAFCIPFVTAFQHVFGSDTGPNILVANLTTYNANTTLFLPKIQADVGMVYMMKAK